MTVLYWRFLLDHERTLARNPRTALMARNAERLTAGDRAAVAAAARRVDAGMDAL